ncbi:hypothetical protein CLCY_4c00260 [Clostridium cylindrosporum DSM 605]|uniref:Uncharacterized protein n=1 Tax=Clostridium cylindrosporum DSM 605 TaxID=1121307 RepID=A0A0J8DCS6_CLOCY|nr:hypothetical protein CLCY_4c00260 [Clostridium cylindrosporum DSM 605]
MKVNKLLRNIFLVLQLVNFSLFLLGLITGKVTIATLFLINGLYLFALSIDLFKSNKISEGLLNIACGIFSIIFSFMKIFYFD